MSTSLYSSEDKTVQCIWPRVRLRNLIAQPDTCRLNGQWSDMESKAASDTDSSNRLLLIARRIKACDLSDLCVAGSLLEHAQHIH